MVWVCDVFLAPECPLRVPPRHFGLLEGCCEGLFLVLKIFGACCGMALNFNSSRSQPSEGRYAGKYVLVTGGAGFIGSHLCRALVSQGARVRVLDNLSSGRAANLPESVQLVIGDISEATNVDSAVDGCSYVFHLAAMVSVPASVADPSRCFSTNVVGTERLIRASEIAGVEGFVHTSSSAVYGGCPALPSRESDPISCESPYAASKACGEFLVQAAARSGRLAGVSLRLFNVFGFRQDPKSAYAAVVSSFIDAAIHRRACNIYGSGSQTRDFIPVHEVVSAFLAAGLRAKESAGEVFNVGLGQGTSVRDLASRINRAAGNDIDSVMHPSRAGDVEHSRACVDKARALLGISLVADIESALAELVRECAAA